MVMMHLYPFTAATNANPIPVLPEATRACGGGARQLTVPRGAPLSRKL